MKFAGRAKQLEQMLDALSSEGADLIVVGERGCGKTSLTTMLHHIAQGNLDILDYYGLRQQFEKKGFIQNLRNLIGVKAKKFNVIWIDAFKRTVDDVIHSVLTRRRDREFGAGLLSYISSEAQQTEISSKIGFDKVFTSEAEVKEIHVAPQPRNIKEGFELAMQRYADQHDEELLIIIDEFETVRDKTEISQYLKSVKRARFVIVGIASTTLELIGEHASVARETQAIKLEPMTDEELRLILDIGSSILAAYNYRFSSGAMNEIVKYSYGSPYWCHFFARALIHRELELAGEFFLTPPVAKQFNKEDVDTLLGTLPERPDCGIYEEALNLITLEDQTTAKILLCIAKRKESVISSSNICDSLETENIQKDIVVATVNDLLEMDGSPFEERRRIRDLVSFSFKDPNFKRYILIRNAGLPI